MRVIPYAVIGVCMFAVLVSEIKAASSPFTGRFQGSGRACYGTLAVQAETISWITPFSQCKSMSYALVEQSRQEGQMRLTYRLQPHPGSCRYTVLSITHRGAADDAGWEVTGYGSEQSYQADKSSGYKTRAEDMMSCYLIRDQAK